MTMHSQWTAYRALTRDRSVADRRVTRAVYRRIFRYARAYRGLIVGFLVLLLVDALLAVAQPLLFRRIIDSGISVGNAAVVTTSAILVAILALSDAGLGIISRYLSSRIGEGLIFDLRTQVYAHVQRQSIAFFTRAQTGALVSRLNTDVIGAQQAFTSTLGGVVGSAISLAVVLGTMLVLSWQITLLSLVLVPLFLLPARWLGGRLQTLTRQQMQMNATMSSQMTERFNVAGAMLAKLFGRPRDEDVAFSEKAAQVRDTGIRIALTNSWFFTSLTLVAALATAIAYGVGGNLVISDALTLGTLLAIIALLAQLYGPLTALSNVRVDVLTAVVSFDRVFEVLDLPPLVADRPEARPLRRGATAVEFRHVGFTYPGAADVSLASLESVARAESTAAGQVVLADVSFRVEAGRMVALVGPSGAGKSTIISLITRLYDASEGAVLVGGSDVREVTQESLHAVVGVVTQDSHMFHDTIRGNLLYARPEASEAELLDACRDAQILDLVEALPDGLDTMVGERGYRLSGGEKQRFAIARLLLKAPDVVVLDEATAHLDSENELAVQRALAHALRGRTSIVIAHRLSTIRDADEILVLSSGAIAERGTHDELLARNGLYADLYRTQFS